MRDRFLKRPNHSCTIKSYLESTIFHRDACRHSCRSSCRDGKVVHLLAPYETWNLERTRGRSFVTVGMSQFVHLDCQTFAVGKRSWLLSRRLIKAGRARATAFTHSCVFPRGSALAAAAQPQSWRAGKHMVLSLCSHIPPSNGSPRPHILSLRPESANITLYRHKLPHLPHTHIHMKTFVWMDLQVDGWMDLWVGGWMDG